MSGNFPPANEREVGRIVQAIRDLFQGRSNAMGSFTCTLNQATTVVEHANVGLESTIHLSPRHANAAAELGAGTIYISAKARGSFTVTHANSATANRTFDFGIIG
jgi:hypothetical protein